MSLYDVLGITPDATSEEVKKAYKSMAQKTHPDKPNGSEKEFQAVNGANAILSDPNRRAEYDQKQVSPAVSKLAELFNSMIDSNDFSGDIIATATSTVNDAILHISKKRKSTNKDVKKFKSLLGRVESKGDNIYENLLNSKIATCEQRILALDADAKIMAEILALLTEYKDTDPQSKFTQPASMEWGRI